MKRISFKTTVDCPFELVVENFDEDLFKNLAPPFIPMKLEKFEGSTPGDLVKLKLNFFQNWTSKITSSDKDKDLFQFIDEGTELPFPIKKWKHIHRVERFEDKSIIIDDIYFDCNSYFLNKLVKPILFKLFSLRENCYINYFEEIKKSA